MIVTCEECDTRFLVPSRLLGDGRKVRCAKCGHTWEAQDPSYVALPEANSEPAVDDAVTPDNQGDAAEPQEPQETPSADQNVDTEDVQTKESKEMDLDEALAFPDDDDLSFVDKEEQGSEEEADGGQSEDSDAPEAKEDDGDDEDTMRPVLDVEEDDGGQDQQGPEEQEGEGEAEGEGNFKSTLPAGLTAKEPVDINTYAVNYGAAALIFLVSFSVLIAMQKSVVAAMPASLSFYKIFGAEVYVEGEELLFGKVDAYTTTDAAGQENLLIEADILNLSDMDVSVPMIDLTAKLENGTVLAEWSVEPPVSMLAANETIPFVVEYEYIDEAVYQVDMVFSLNPRAAHGDKEETEHKDAHH